MNCNRCTHERDEAWAFCPFCGQKVSLTKNSTPMDNKDLESVLKKVFEAPDQFLSSTAFPHSSVQTPGQRLIDIRSSLLKLGNSCNQDSPLRSELSGIVATVDEVIQSVEQLGTSGWRDSNSQLQLDLQRELQKSREIKPNDEKGPHRITMKRQTGF